MLCCKHSSLYHWCNWQPKQWRNQIAAVLAAWALQLYLCPLTLYRRPLSLSSYLHFLITIYVIKIKKMFVLLLRAVPLLRTTKKIVRRTSIIINLLWNFYKQHENPLLYSLSVFFFVSIAQPTAAEAEDDKRL